MSKYQIALPGAAPSAPQRDPGRDAYLGWCADCERVLRVVLLAGGAELARWAITKAQARRVARQIEGERLAAGSDRQDLGRLHALMRLAPSEGDRLLAESLAEEVRGARETIARRGRCAEGPDQLLARALGGGAPRLLAHLLDAASGESLLPPPSQAAEAYLRAISGGRRARSEDERDADARRAADAWVREAQPC